MKFNILAIFLLISAFPQAQSVNLAPDFPMQLHDGTTKDLSDYEGNVVYISFWASWCAPCIKNFEKYRDIRAELVKEGVVLLNVNIDKDKEKWIQSMEKLDLKGVNVFASKEDLYPQYAINSIPLYEIVGKKGQLLYLSDESGRDIMSQFKSWLTEE